MQTRLQVFLAENLESGQSDQWDQLINHLKISSVRSFYRAFSCTVQSIQSIVAINSVICSLIMSLRQYNLSITRDQRLVIKTALLFKISYQQIQSTLNVIIRQIFYARNAPITSQKKDKCEIKSLIRTPQRNALQE
jgi:low affinity Fe/Cu permease